LGCLGRVADGGDADTMLQFRLERGGDGTKRYRKMKRRQGTRLGSTGDGVVMTARGEAALGRREGGDNTSWADTNFTGPKNKENSRGRFSCYK
jgi:hypothetical protein